MELFQVFRGDYFRFSGGIISDFSGAFISGFQGGNCAESFVIRNTTLAAVSTIATGWSPPSWLRLRGRASLRSRPMCGRCLTCWWMPGLQLNMFMECLHLDDWCCHQSGFSFYFLNIHSMFMFFFNSRKASLLNIICKRFISGKCIKFFN